MERSFVENRRLPAGISHRTRYDSLSALQSVSGLICFRLKVIYHTIGFLCCNLNILDLQFMCIDSDLSRRVLDLKFDLDFSMIAEVTAKFNVVQRYIIVDWLDASRCKSTGESVRDQVAYFVVRTSLFP